MAEGQAVWEVIGGKDKGGIMVREGRGLRSKEAAERLAFASFVEEVELVGERLHYKLMTGSGPETGWVSINIGDKDLLKCIIKPPPKPPLFCAWYSGGFTTADGEKLLSPLMDAVHAAGVEKRAILHFPDAYEMSGEGWEGRAPWSKYVDKLVEEINKVSDSDSQPLVLFGHSRGAAPAICVASRLGARVKQVYIAACGAMRAGEATAWEALSKNFKQGGDRELLGWFYSLQPENVFLKRAVEKADDEFEEQVNSSKFLSDMLSLMRRQYRDAMYPDPDRDFKAVPANVTAFAALLDEGSQPEHMEDWKLLTLAKFQNVSLNAGHMDCLAPNTAGKCELFEFLQKDLKQFIS
ncbi:Calcium-dependent protein kinase 2 [Durusdinium trenchii]|uniref:Calcium-dependent protein kinase 2 n=1 Tax=Durusdinium trenchii TaxID=1381693 RepID=A0ABP0M983_9DINO